MATKKIRLNLEFTTAIAECLEELRELTGSRSRVDVIRKALSFLKLYYDTREEGGRIIIRHADGVEEVPRFL